MLAIGSVALSLALEANSRHATVESAKHSSADDHRVLQLRGRAEHPKDDGAQGGEDHQCRRG
jgi:hypothetical protein